MLILHSAGRIIDRILCSFEGAGVRDVEGRVKLYCIGSWQEEVGCGSPRYE